MSGQDFLMHTAPSVRGRRPSPSLRCLLVCLATAALGLGEALPATLSSSQFRKFRGRYSGDVSGIAGNAAVSREVGPFSTTIRVRKPRRESLRPLISDLYLLRAHTIVWRKPKGTANRRAALTGIYQGKFTDSSGTQYQVEGMRKLVLTRRKSKGAARYVAKLTDDLREVHALSGNPYAAQRLSGRLRR